MEEFYNAGDGMESAFAAWVCHCEGAVAKLYEPASFMDGYRSARCNGGGRSRQGQLNLPRAIDRLSAGDLPLLLPIHNESFLRYDQRGEGKILVSE